MGRVRDYKREREREREFAKSCILQIKSANSPQPLRILDIGSSSSYVPLQLARQGHQVVAVDIRPYPLRHRNLTYISGDVTDASFGEGLSPFDVVTCISTLEHIGLGYYGEKMARQGDEMAVATLHRLLKPGGSLLLTLPFAGKFSQDDFQRVYDFENINRLFSVGWRLKEERFHIPRSRKNWVIANKQQVLQCYAVYPESNNACFWFEKLR
ncbi:MAG: hypothetical protein DRG58_04425 [Deltaproteobacteria bacterium]|nr:MAG: hypothetical protein DRG58_04425 [Deltaproteobacteria bacterium]